MKELLKKFNLTCSVWIFRIIIENNNSKGCSVCCAYTPVFKNYELSKMMEQIVGCEANC